MGCFGQFCLLILSLHALACACIITQEELNGKILRKDKGKNVIIISNYK